MASQLTQWGVGSATLQLSEQHQQLAQTNSSRSAARVTERGLAGAAAASSSSSSNDKTQQKHNKPAKVVLL
jgi:hypothetical protein